VNRIIKLSGLFLFLLAGCFSVSRIAVKKLPDIPREKQILIAVVDFENKTGEPENQVLTEGIYGKIADELTETRRFRLIERKRLESVLEEMNLQMTGLVEPSKAKEAAGLLGIDALLFGELSTVKYEKNKQTIFVLWTEGQKTEITLNARLVDVKTGEILATTQAASFVKQRNWVAFWFARLGRKMEKASVLETGIELASRKAAQDLAEKTYR